MLLKALCCIDTSIRKQTEFTELIYHNKDQEKYHVLVCVIMLDFCRPKYNYENLHNATVVCTNIHVCTLALCLLMCIKQ